MSRLRDTIEQAKTQVAENIRAFALAYPLASYREIGAIVGCSEDFVQAVMKRAGLTRRPGRKQGKQAGRG